MPREIFHASLPVTEKFRENEMNKNESFSIYTKENKSNVIHILF